ncbi:hypothetical protein FQA39_LY04094 [Lamprigera yunnana]|nr:hypothetical protein FQA39_LY04094 [Lamprigera yunnana]
MSNRTLWVFVFCVFFTLGNAKEDLAASTENILKKALDDFAAVQEKFVKENVKVITEFSKTEIGHDDVALKRDVVELQPLEKPKPIKGSVAFDATIIKTIFDLARKFHIKAAASRERFDEKGILQSRTVYGDPIKIHYEDGNSNIQMKYEDESDDATLEELIDVVKQFELPISATKTEFDESGNSIGVERQAYIPQKVKIISVKNMPIAMQMKIAEALKRSCIMKQASKDRIALLVRYLGIQFPKYTYSAVVGYDDHHVESDISIKVTFDGNDYIIWGTIAEEE